MKKVENNGTYSIYMASNNHALMTTNRYIIAMVPTDTYFIGQQIPLSKLDWKVFQALSIPVKHNVPSFSYMPKKNSPYNSPLVMEERMANYTTYKSSLYPIHLSLFSVDGTNIFPLNGNLNSALETFNVLLKIEN
jgi:hypothetical protein